MKTVYGEAIKRDEDYLRDDEQQIENFLKGERKILTVSGPRRFGKTSFLYRISRFAEERKLLSIYLTCELPSKILYGTISTETNTKMKTSTALDEYLSGLNKHIYFLIDEANAGVFSSNDDSEKIKQLLKIILHHSEMNEFVHFAIAEVPLFYEECRKEGSGFENLVNQPPECLMPVINIKKEEVIYIQDSAIDLIKIGRKVGNIPIEIQAVRKTHEEFDPEETDPSNREEEFILSLSDILNSPYSAIFQTLYDNEQSLLRLVASVPTIYLKELNSKGRRSLKELGKNGYGILKRNDVGKILMVSEIFKEYVAETQEPSKDDIKKVLSVRPSGIKVQEGPRPTFNKDFVIHQIGDLHFGVLGRKDNGEHVANNYKKYLYSNKEWEKKPHVIVICGDVASIGDRKELIRAKKFIEEIKNIRDMNNQPAIRPLYQSDDLDFEKQILLVPGNHDADWYAEEPEKPIDKFIDTFGNFITTPFSQPPAVSFYPVGVTFLLMNSAEYQGDKIKSDGGLSKLNQNLKDEYRKYDNRILTAFKDMRDWLTNSVKTGANDSDDAKAFLLNQTMRFSQGYIGEKTLKNIGKNLDKAEKKPFLKKKDKNLMSPRNIRIAVGHHNLSNFHDITLFVDLCNSAHVRNTLINKEICILLYGHKHDGMVTSEILYDKKRGKQQLYTIGVGSLLGGGFGVPPSFNEIRIDCGASSKEKGVIGRQIRVIKYDLEKSGFNVNWNPSNIATLTVGK